MPSELQAFRNFKERTRYTRKNGAVSKVNKKFISHLTRSQRTPSAATTVQVSHALITYLQCVHPGSHDSHPCGNQTAANGDDNLLSFARSYTVRFLFWGFVKDSVYVPPLSASVHELRDRITHALQAITADMLQWVWDEFDCRVDVCRVDVCRVTQGAHIEGL
jgi:hypothetical protein